VLDVSVLDLFSCEPNCSLPGPVSFFAFHPLSQDKSNRAMSCRPCHVFFSPQSAVFPHRFFLNPSFNFGVKGPRRGFPLRGSPDVPFGFRPRDLDFFTGSLLRQRLFSPSLCLSLLFFAHFLDFSSFPCFRVPQTLRLSTFWGGPGFLPP